MSVFFSIIFIQTDEGNHALQEFLLSKNPKQEHSSTLESYLIKPIQRILKYPLLLQQLKNLTDTYAEEHHHLIEALKGMEKVAEHINEMQRIHEEYGAIFDHLFRQHQKACKQPIDLSPGNYHHFTFVLKNLKNIITHGNFRKQVIYYITVA